MPNQFTGPKQVFHVEDTTKVDSSQLEVLGTRALDGKGNEHIYLQGTASVVARDLVVYDENFGTTRLTANEVGPVAVAATAVVLGQYGWFQISGMVQVNSDTISADKSLYIDGTAGRVDDLGVSGDLIIGAYSMTASVSNVATASINYPHVSDDLGGSVGGSPGGADTNVQFNDGSSFGGDGGFTFDKTTGIVTATAFITRTGTVYAVAGYPQVRLADGGTGTATAAGARINLGLVIGTNVQAWDNDLDDIAALTHSGTGVMISNGTDWVNKSAANARGDLGLSIGQNVQAWDNDLDDIAALAHSGTGFMVSNGTDWLNRSAANARGDIGLSVPIVVASGGSGTTSIGARAVLIGGTTDTGSFQTVSGLGQIGQVLTSSGAGVNPSWKYNATASIQTMVFDSGTNVSTGSAKMFLHVDSKYSGMHLVYAHARHLQTAPTGIGSRIEIINTGGSGTSATGTAMLSTILNIDSGESGSHTSATAVVISNTGSAVLLNDLLRIDIGSAGSTATAQGLLITLGFNHA